MKKVSFTLMSFFLFMLAAFSVTPLEALPITEHTISGFKKEIIRGLNNLFKLNFQQTGDNLFFQVKNQEIGEFPIAEAEIRIEGISKDAISAIQGGNATFEEVRKIESINGTVKLAESDLNKIIRKKIDRQKGQNPLLESLEIQIGNSEVEINGTINLWKILTSLPFFSIQASSKIEATIKFNLQNNQVLAEIVSGKINGVEITPEIKSQLLNWLNPMWDFSKVPFPCGIEEFKLQDGTLWYKGYIFNSR
ncbi:MAG: LmeA family phospholipid-binding protein [Candidatus Riflebacteria bacterium]|nr:LmeA family phospholipid-binding protein [Candidatus Riflebacteria bacterium]